MPAFRHLSILAAALACGILSSQARAADPEQTALATHLLNRLAFGPAPGDIERVAQMGAQRYIASQLQPEALPMPPELLNRLAALEMVHKPAGEVLQAFLETRDQKKDETPESAQLRRATLNKINTQTHEARLLRAVSSPRQLEEVLVDFWFNHFNVYANKGHDKALVASYERDAIRPYVFGSFRDLLGATAHHPAMLHYLDNWVSRNKGVNENYARELMELHTLGVDDGYTQKDVTELARMLTGWTYVPKRMLEENETFRFDPKRHDTGDKVWLGRTVKGLAKDDGRLEGERALDVLAAHPATARHISTKLAQYFVQDQPPPALVARMAATWADTRGDIRAVLKTLLTSDEFLSPQVYGAKFKTPYQFVISAVRASGEPLAEIQPVVNALNRLGMPLYGCQTPDGYKNTQQAWLNPDGLAQRIAYATTVGQKLDPEALRLALGPSVSGRTQGALSAHPEKLRAAMLLGGPDFMQR